MSLEQVIFALAGTICAVGAALAVIHRDPRVAGAALTGTLLSLAVLYAGLAAPALAAAVLVLALFVTAPLVVHLTVAAPRAHPDGGPLVAGAGLLAGVGLVTILALAVAVGEVPVNVSVHSSDGYDLVALRELLTGRAAAAIGVSVLVLVAAGVAARAVRGERRPAR